MKVLVLSCSTGGGHNSCARYIKEEFDSFNIECDFYDFFDLICFVSLMIVRMEAFVMNS